MAAKEVNKLDFFSVFIAFEGKTIEKRGKGTKFDLIEKTDAKKPKSRAKFLVK